MYWKDCFSLSWVANTYFAKMKSDCFFHSVTMTFAKLSQCAFSMVKVCFPIFRNYLEIIHFLLDATEYMKGGGFLQFNVLKPIKKLSGSLPNWSLIVFYTVQTWCFCSWKLFTFWWFLLKTQKGQFPIIMMCYVPLSIIAWMEPGQSCGWLYFS